MDLAMSVNPFAPGIWVSRRTGLGCRSAWDADERANPQALVAWERPKRHDDAHRN